MKKLFLSTIVASALIIPASVYAAPNTNDAPPAQTEPHKAGPKHDGPKHHKKGDKGDKDGSRMEKHNAMMKDRFMKMEQELKLRPDQKPIWSKYVAANMEMMAPMERPKADQKQEALLPGERMADRLLAQKPKAERLKAIANEMRKTLDDGQKQRLQEMNAEQAKKRMAPRPHHPAPAPDAAPDKAKP